MADDKSRPEARLVASELKRVTNDEELLFSFKLRDFNKEIAVSSRRIGTAVLKITVHKSRHAGASGDLLRKARPVPEVFARGQGLTEGSVRRYGRPGILAKQWSLLPESTRGTLLDAPDRVAKMIPQCLG